MENKQEQIKKIISKAADLEKGKEIAMAKELLDINEKQEETLQAIKDIPEAEPFPTKMRVQLEGIDVITINGRDGHTPTEDELQSLIKPLIPEPIKGDSYILTKNDKVEISRLVKVPIVEKIETVREIPMITNEVIEVAVSDEPIIIKEKLESLKDEERLDISAIKGVEKSNNTLSDNIINRAIGIVDQRTSFLINKVSNLSAQVSAGGGGGSGWSLTGNAGTTPGTNFVGTTDAQDLVFKVNTQEKLRLLNTGSSNTDVAMVLGQVTSGELSIKFREDQNETLQLYSAKSGTDMTTVVSNNASSTSILELAANGVSGYIRFTPTTAVEIRNRLPLRFWDSGNNYYAGFRAGGSMSSDITWTLPTTDSTGTQALVSNGSGVMSWQTITNEIPVSIQVACSDLTTTITTGTSKAYFRAPYAFTLTEVRASLLTGQTAGSLFTVNIKDNGSSILSTKITIDNNETTSTTATTPPVISSSNIVDDRIITIDVDAVGTGSPVGLIVTLLGTRNV